MLVVKEEGWLETIISVYMYANDAMLLTKNSSDFQEMLVKL